MALNTAETDHYTPLSRAVASIDRDAYAARFAIYDRAHKALLKRLATATSPPTTEDIEREEKAFREAVRRVEFADELAQEEAESPALVPQHEPPEEEEVLHELRRDPWPDVRPRRESAEAQEEAYEENEGYEPDVDFGALEPDRPRRSVTRRVSERLLLAVCLLALGGVWLYIADQRQQQAIEAARTAPPADDTVASAPPPDPRSFAPSWLSSPELFYTAPPMPTAPAAAPPPRVPQAPPPVRRPAPAPAPNP
jgi:hypothetical protein